MERKLNIAFLWHMHQPMYRDPLTDEYILPWVLLHATKDYYDMVSILDDFPQIHQTFNLVPSLIEQIQEYSSSTVKDRYRSLCLKKTDELRTDERHFILKNFFQVNWDTMVRPFPRYWELLRKRGFSSEPEDIEASLRYFKNQDILDLQVLFNLVWIDMTISEKDEFLRYLVGKGRNFTEEEKLRLLDKQIEIVRMVLPKYREMMERGMVEITTSPYFHPIMPLLYDTLSAREPSPDIGLPHKRFNHPEDVMAQIKKGIELYTETFGTTPAGLWPPEGAVSMDILPLVKEAGIEWIATDEGILARSMGRPLQRDHHGNPKDLFLYSPYSVDTERGPLTVVFRDRILSDLIGFEYARMDAQSACEDFVKRLLFIASRMEEPERCLVSIILDGENAWEYYKNDGRDFLVALYSRLASQPELRCVTVSEFLSSHRERKGLPRLSTGSWINSNLDIWIGHPEDHRAWEYIKDARDRVVESGRSGRVSKDTLERAWYEVYASEGSDWFWWYGDEHSSPNDEDFDILFRDHIKKIYNLIGLEPPQGIDIPIPSRKRGYKPSFPPRAFIYPEIDGEVTNYFEWLASGRLERVHAGSAMHREVEGGGLIERIFYGFNIEKLFFRFDYLREFRGYNGEWSFTINFLNPRPLKITVTVKGRTTDGKIYERIGDRWEQTGELKEIGSNTVVELAIPFSTIGAGSGEEMWFFISIDGRERGIERWPIKGYLIQEVPSEDFDSRHWMV